MEAQGRAGPWWFSYAHHPYCNQYTLLYISQITQLECTIWSLLGSLDNSTPTLGAEEQIEDELVGLFIALLLEMDLLYKYTEYLGMKHLCPK